MPLDSASTTSLIEPPTALPTAFTRDSDRVMLPKARSDVMDLFSDVRGDTSFCRSFRPFGFISMGRLFAAAPASAGSAAAKRTPIST